MKSLTQEFAVQVAGGAGYEVDGLWVGVPAFVDYRVAHNLPEDAITPAVMVWAIEVSPGVYAPIENPVFSL